MKMLAFISHNRFVRRLYDAGFSFRFVLLMTGIAAAIAWVIVPTLQSGYEYAVGILHIKIVRDPEVGKIETLFSMDLDHIESL